MYTEVKKKKTVTFFSKTPHRARIYGHNRKLTTARCLLFVKPRNRTTDHAL